MSIIDPLEPVIKYLLADAVLQQLLHDRIAARELYGTGKWVKPAAGMQVRLDGGVPDLYGDTQIPRLEFRVWAGSNFEARKVYRRMVEISRLELRVSVTTANDGTALLHTLYLETLPSMLFDPDVGMEMLLWFMTAWIGEESTV